MDDREEFYVAAVVESLEGGGDVQRYAGVGVVAVSHWDREEEEEEEADHLHLFVEEHEEVEEEEEHVEEHVEEEERRQKGEYLVVVGVVEAGGVVVEMTFPGRL